MLSIIGATIVLTIAVAFMVRFVNVLFSDGSTPTKQVTEQANDEVLAVSPEHLENILQFRLDTITLIQSTDLRLQCLDLLPTTKRRTPPPSFGLARCLNDRAKLEYDNNNYCQASSFAQRAAEEIQRAERIINLRLNNNF